MHIHCKLETYTFTRLQWINTQTDLKYLLYDLVVKFWIVLMKRTIKEPFVGSNFATSFNSTLENCL